MKRVFRYRDHREALCTAHFALSMCAMVWGIWAKWGSLAVVGLTLAALFAVGLSMWSLIPDEVHRNDIGYELILETPDSEIEEYQCENLLDVLLTTFVGRWEWIFNWLRGSR